MKEFGSRIERIEALVKEIEEVDDSPLHGRIRELLQLVLDLHGSALSRVLDEAYEACGQGFIDRLGADEEVGSLLLLHGLHPLSRAQRVMNALDRVAPYLASHGGSVELVDVTEDDTVVLRLQGSCHGCPSSEATLKYTIEEAVFTAAPDVRAIRIDPGGDGESDDFIPMAKVLWDDCPFPASAEKTDTKTSTS